MKYYTAKGDEGTTKLYGCPDGVRISKCDEIFEVLGGLDELNSCLGLARAVACRASLPRASPELRKHFVETLRSLQEHLFIIQAKLGGAPHTLPPSKLSELESLIEMFAQTFPPITSFIIPGETELAGFLDICRTKARRIERLYLRLPAGKKKSTLGKYLNRLSSALYVLARFAVHAEGREEESPTYT